MKSLSCMSGTRDSLPPPHRLDDQIDTYKDDTKTAVLGQKGPKMHTLIEVLRCELAKPRRSVPNNRLAPSKQWTPIYYAVYLNREAALLHFLRAGQSPDDASGTGQPLICIAVEAGHVEAVKILCEAGADIKAPAKDNGETALHLSIRAGRTDMIDVLLAYGPDLGARTTDTGETPLHYAAAKPGLLATVVDLLKRGASYNTLNSRGCSPAEVALQAQNIHAAVAIINAARGKRGSLAKEKEMLWQHVEKSQNRFSMNNELISDIFSASCDPDSTVLVEAIKRDDASLVEMFLGKGEDPNRSTANGSQPIFAAINCAGAKIIHSLVKHGVDLTVQDSEGCTILQAVFDSPLAHDKEAITGVLDILLSSGADPKVTYPDGKTLLHQAVNPGLGLARTAQRLLQLGLGVNVPDVSGNSPLHLATSRSCIEVLLKNGADANLLNHHNLTPLLHIVTSARKEKEPDLEPLIKVSQLRAIDSSGNTALHLAAQNGLERTVRALLKHRAETTVYDSKMRIPLHLAVLSHQWSVVSLLMTQPGVNTWDASGSTALHHVVTSIPQPPATWKDIASATMKFCEKGVSRSMRDKSGATPLIQAVKELPEEGISVIEALLSGLRKSNCVEHEDHKHRSALHFAATLGKPLFVQALLKNGAIFALKEWTVTNGPLKPTTKTSKQTLKLLAEHEWLRRTIMLRRRSGEGTEEVAVLPKILPVHVLKDLLSMGLDANAVPIPKSRTTGLLLWTILNAITTQPSLPPQYLYDASKLILASGADANAPTMKSATPDSQQRLSVHPVSFLLEQHKTVDIDLITLLLDRGANLATSSPLYNGSYPLHSAVRSNRLDLVDEFLHRKVDPNAADAQQSTPLFIATENGFWEIAELLLSCGAKVHARDVIGNTPLHSAVIGGSPRIVSALLQKSAKVGVKNKKDKTPLSCLPENISEKDKSSITALLNKAEKQEKRSNQPTQQQSPKPLAVVENKSTARLRLPSTTTNTTTIKPPRTPDNPIPRSSLDSTPKLATSIQISRRRVSVLYTPPSPRPFQTTFSASPTPSKSPNPPSNPATDKPLPRVDSGVGSTKTTPTTEKVPTLDRNQSSFGGRGGGGDGNRDSKEEIRGWLAMSRLLEMA